MLLHQYTCHGAICMQLSYWISTKSNNSSGVTRDVDMVRLVNSAGTPCVLDGVDGTAGLLVTLDVLVDDEGDGCDDNSE